MNKINRPATVVALMCGTAWVQTVGVFGASPPGGPPSLFETTEVALSGMAKGGTLIYAQTPERNTERFVSIATEPGESAESVVRRLAEAINARRDLGGARANGNTLADLGLLKGMFFFAGNESGLGIPPPPRSVTANYDPDANQIRVFWENPPDAGYDDVSIVCEGFGCGGVRSDSGTEYVFGSEARPLRRDPRNLGLCVIGFRNGVPSSASPIHLKGHIQEESIGVPFANGVAPNWTAWSDAEADASAMEEGRRAREVKGKTFFQRIKSRNVGAQVGAWRKFLGLTPGHTYKISAWVNTSDMAAVEADWSFSLHATYLPPGGGDLSNKQMAGTQQLPGGEVGPEAAQFARYENGSGTPNRFVRASTDSREGGPGRLIDHIALPPGTDSIIVWAKYRCDVPDAPGVALDHLRLEDLSLAHRFDDIPTDRPPW